MAKAIDELSTRFDRVPVQVVRSQSEAKEHNDRVGFLDKSTAMCGRVYGHTCVLVTAVRVYTQTATIYLLVPRPGCRRRTPAELRARAEMEKMDHL